MSRFEDTPRIVPGTSLSGTTMQALVMNGFTVTAGIELQNLTRYRLTDPKAVVKGGAITRPPLTIEPYTNEAMIARKTYGTPTGSYGTVSWLIEGTEQRVVVMWSAPFNFTFYTNRLAVGIAEAGAGDHPCDDSWFNKMYSDNSSGKLHFARQEYGREVCQVVYRNKEFVVEGIMSANHKAVATIYFKCRKDQDPFM